MKVNIFKILLFTLGWPALLIYNACDSNLLEPTKPEIEDEIKGHDEWNRIELTLLMGKMSDDKKNFYAFDEKYQSIIPIKQTMTIGRSNDGTGSVKILSGATDGFKVIKGKNIYYALDIKYYDRKNRLMNYQFCSYPPEPVNQMLPIHQHFFIVSDKDFNGKTAYPTTLDNKNIDEFGTEHNRPNIRRMQELTRKVFTYIYRDTDPVDKMIGETYIDEKTKKLETVDFIRKYRSKDINVPYDRVGLKGLLKFVRPNIKFQMRIDLVHVIPGDKYIGKSKGGLLDFDQRHIGWSVSDVILKLPFSVVADLESKDYLKQLSNEFNKTEKEMSIINNMKLSKIRY